MSWISHYGNRFSCRTVQLGSAFLALILLPVLLRGSNDLEREVLLEERDHSVEKVSKKHKKESIDYNSKKDITTSRTENALESRKICNEKLTAWKNHSVVLARFPRLRNQLGQPQNISVYSSGDRVSNSIKTRGHWDFQKTAMIISRLGKLSKDAVFLDIGANIGWFTMAAAYAGHRVIAVEPFETNIAHIEHSLCLAPNEVRDRVTIVQCGLGDKDGDVCELWQDPSVNHGDTHTVCDKVPRVWNHNPAYKFRKLGEVHLFKLDSLISTGNLSLKQDDKVIVKIDTEGYEPFAFFGAKKFLSEIQPSLIISEFGPAMMKASAKALNWSEDKVRLLPPNYLKFMRGLGYYFKYPNADVDIQDVLFESNQTTKS